MTPRTVVLHNDKAGSDKVYMVLLEGHDDVWSVNFRYGRRVPGDGYQIQGNKGGTKTEVPQPYEGALAIFEDLVKRQQTEKGYVLVSDDYLEGNPNGVPISVQVFKEHSGYSPMLLKEVKDETQAWQLCRNPSYCLQEKFDGERRMLLKRGGMSVKGINRKGEFTEIPQAVRNETELIPRNSYLLDGEEIGEKFYVFDLLMENDQPYFKDSMQVRYERLKTLVTFRNDFNIQVVRTAFKTEDKIALFESVKARGGEGVVFKFVSAPYEQKRSRYALKWKFKARATVQVLEIHPSKRSVKMGAFDEEGCLKPIGNVTIPSNYEVPREGAIVGVEYLYYFPGGSLFQPVYQGVDELVHIADRIQSFKTKANPEIEDDFEDAEVSGTPAVN